jgi:uncharacterized LabA/DUF88 family protein
MTARLYVDGFNFYYAIRNSAKKGDFPIGLGWCDFRALAERYLVTPGETLDVIKYFTAPVERFAIRRGEEKRQQLWLDALSTIRGLEVITGLHQQHDTKPREEKQTDINIAVELLVDAVLRECQHAILITGDIDQAPVVTAARKRLPPSVRIDVDVWVPPGLSYGRWKKEAAAKGFTCRQLTAGMLVESRLADRIETRDGRVITCIDEWRIPPR